MITYLLDFMLEKHSPLTLYEKKHQMGKNKFYLFEKQMDTLN